MDEEGLPDEKETFETTKHQLAQALLVFDRFDGLFREVYEVDFLERTVFRDLELLNIILGTSPPYSAAEIYDIAVRSLKMRDADLALDIRRGNTVVTNARYKLLAAILTALPADYTQHITVHPRVEHYLKLLEDGKKARFLERASAIASSPKAHPLVSTLFEEWLEKKTITLPTVNHPDDGFYADRAMRSFLNPLSERMIGFPRVLRFILFSNMNEKYIPRLAGQIAMLASLHDKRKLHLGRNDPRYGNYNNARNATNDFDYPYICSQIFRLAEIISKTGIRKAEGFTSRELELVKTTYNLMLVDQTMPKEEALLLAFQSPTENLLFMLKNLGV